MEERDERTAAVRFTEIAPTGALNDETFVFIHGLGGSLEQWADVLEVVGAQARAISVDIPGFGRSRNLRGSFDPDLSVAILRNFLIDHSVDNCTLVSHSVGFVIAGRLAALEPSKVKRVVLVSGALIRASNLAQHPLRFFTEPKLGSIVAIQFIAGIFPLPKRFVTALAASAGLRRLILWPFVAHPAKLESGALRRTLQGTGSFAVLRVLFTARRIDYLDAIAGIAQPTTLITGDRDRLIRDDDLTAIRQMLTVSDEYRLYDCGHWPWVECADHVASIILSEEM